MSEDPLYRDFQAAVGVEAEGGAGALHSLCALGWRVWPAGPAVQHVLECVCPAYCAWQLGLSPLRFLHRALAGSYVLTTLRCPAPHPPPCQVRTSRLMTTSLSREGRTSWHPTPPAP